MYYLELELEIPPDEEGKACAVMERCRSIKAPERGSRKEAGLVAIYCAADAHYLLM